MLSVCARFNIKMDYYKILKGENKVQCLKCEKKLSTSNKNNLLRHYKLVHNEEIVFTKKRKSTEKLIDPLTKIPNISVKLNIDKNYFLKCCLGLVTVKNIPLQIFDDREFFKTLISPYEEIFNTNLNSQNILKVVESSSNKIRDIIRNKLKNRMISLKIDIASKIDRSILCVNVQYINNYKICTNTLGLIQLSKKYKPMFLKEEVLNYLEAYDIEQEQIYSSTFDNGSNDIKFAEILHEHQVDKLEQNFTQDNIDEIDDNIQRSLTPILPNLLCAARSIQLAANDVIKTLLKPIADCRKVYKQTCSLIRSNSLYDELPVLDNTTSWSSIFQMFKNLENLKSFIETQAKDGMTNSQTINWNFVTEFIKSFRPLVYCAKLMQTEQYILGDFYRDWLNCEIDLEDIPTTIATRLREAMQHRKKLLHENDAFLAALFLDPRFNFLNSTILSKEQKSQAVEHLVKTFNAMEEIDNLEDNSLLVEMTSATTTTTTNSESEEIDETPTTSSGAYAKLAQRIMRSALNTSRSIENKLTFREKLMNLCKTNMVALDTNILAYFQATPLDPDILRVINVTLATPASQASVERAYRALAVGNKLNNSTVNNLLVTKLNFSEIKHNNVNIGFYSEQDLKLA